MNLMIAIKSRLKYYVVRNPINLMTSDAYSWEVSEVYRISLLLWAIYGFEIIENDSVLPKNIRMNTVCVDVSHN